MANFSIAPIGLATEERRLLDTVIELAAGIEVGDWAVQPDIEQADVALIVLDSLRGSETFKQRQWHPDGQLLVLKSDNDTHIWQTNVEISQAAGYTYYTQLLHRLENLLIQRRVQGIRPSPHHSPAEPSTIETTSSDEAPPAKTERPSCNPTGLDDLDTLDVNTPATSDGEIREQEEILLESLAVSDFISTQGSAQPYKADFTNVVSFQRPDALDRVSKISEVRETGYPFAPLLETLSGLALDSGDRVLACEIDELVKPTTTLDEPEESDLLLDTLGDTAPPRPLIRSVKKFYAATCFLGHLQSILMTENPSVISHVDYPDVFIHPGLGLFACKADLNRYQGIYREPFYEFQVSETSWKRRPRGHELSIWILLYEAAYHGANGRLIANASPKASFSLKKLPELDRVSCINSNVAEEVLLALQQQPSDFEELLRRVSCPPADLANLLSAWIAAGFVTQSDMGPQPGTNQPSFNQSSGHKTGFFGRLRRSLARHPG